MCWLFETRSFCIVSSLVFILASSAFKSIRVNAMFSLLVEWSVTGASFILLKTLLMALMSSEIWRDKLSKYLAFLMASCRFLSRSGSLKYLLNNSLCTSGKKPSSFQRIVLWSSPKKRTSFTKNIKSSNSKLVLFFMIFSYL